MTEQLLHNCTELEQEDIITNKNLLFYFSGHNNDLLVLKAMESCILKPKQTKKSQPKPKKQTRAKQNKSKYKKRIKTLLLSLPRRRSSRGPFARRSRKNVCIARFSLLDLLKNARSLCSLGRCFQASLGARALSYM